MATSKRSSKRRTERKLRLESLEARRVFAALVFDSVITTENQFPSKAYGFEAARDSQGNVYTSGSFTGTVDFDRHQSFIDNRDILSVSTADQAQGYLAKYNPQGGLEWVRQVEHSAAASAFFAATYITLDSQDQPILHTTYSGTVTIGNQTMASQGLKDVLVAKFNEQGTLQWMQNIGTEFDDSNSRVVADAHGRITAMVSTNNSGLREMSLLQFAADGSSLWRRDFSSFIGQELLVTSDNSLILAGKYQGSADIDPSGNESLLPESPISDIRNDFIAKFSSEGALEWATAFRQDSIVANEALYPGIEMTIGADGMLAFVDGYSGGVTLFSDSNSFSLPYTEIHRSIFGKLDPASGELVTSYMMEGFVYPSGIAAIDGGYALTGYTGGSGFTYLEGFSPPSVGPGSNDGFLVTLNEHGQPDWVGLFGGSSNDFPTAIRSDGEGGILVAGYSSSPDFDFDPTAYVAESVPNVGSFVLQVHPRRPGTEVKLFEYDFEPTNWSTHWVQDSQLDWFRSTQRSSLGGYSAEVDGSANNATLTTANVIDLTGLESAQLTFDWLIESGFDSGEYLSLDISTNGGSSWIQDVRRLSGNVSAENLWHSEVVDLTPYMSADLKVRFRAKVSASDEDANVDNVRITGIVAGPNTSPIADAGSGYETSEGSSILLSAAASSDPDGSIVSYAWDFDNDGQYDDAVGMTVNFSTTASGPQTVGLQVMDNRGAIATTTTTVLVNNVAPTADAGGNLTGSIGQPINLSAAASSDPGQDIVSYQWDLDNDGFYNDADGISAVFTSAVAGAFTVGLKVTDADGAVDFDSLTITITSAPALSTKFYVVDDSATDRTFEYSADGIAVENYGLTTGNTSPRGAASTVAGDKVWVVDANKRVYVYDDSGVLLGSWTPGSLASTANVEGITTDGTDIWLVDNRRDRVYRYAGAASRVTGSQNAASSFVLNSSNLSPKDLVTDGNHIWVVNDNSTDRVFKYTMSGSLVGSWTIDAGNSKPTGITIDPSGASQSIWIVDNGTDRVYEYANARGRNSGSQSATVWFALAAGNGNPQGIADPPPVGSEARTQAPIIPTNGAMSSRVVNHQLDSHRLLSTGRSERAQDEQRETVPSLNAEGSQSQRFDQTHSESLFIEFSKLSVPQVDRPSHRMVDEVFADVDAFDGFDDFMLVIE